MRATVSACLDKGYSAVARYLVNGEAYRQARSKLARFWLRVRMYIFYPINLFFYTLVPHREVCVVTSNTFFAPWIAARFCFSKKRKIVHLVYDIFPDALIEAGVLRDGSLACQIIEWIMKDTFRLSSQNIFLGKHLLQNACKRFGTISNAEIIPVGSIAAPFKEQPPKLMNTTKMTTVLYCGNLGRLHDYLTLTTAIDASLDAEWLKKVGFRFHANGFLYSSLKEKIQEFPEQIRKLFTLEGNLEDTAWEETMQEAEIALVTMAPGAEKVVMPSKTYSAMLAGQAILAIASRESDLADLICEYECGWVISPGDAESLSAVLEEIASSPEIVFTKRKNAFAAGHRYYSAEAVADSWMKLVDRLSA